MNFGMIVSIFSMLMPGEGQSGSEPQSLKALDDECLRCMCFASSTCDPGVRCHTVGPIGYFCGPYQISEKYWTQAGSPGASPSNPLDYEDCANDLFCAIKAVKGYMKRWAKDCDGDGSITCKDLVLLHEAGPRRCHEKWMKNTKYWYSYEKCVRMRLKYGQIS